MKRLKHFGSIIGVGVTMGFVLFLGPQACSDVGDAMLDAGEWLRDAGDATSDAFIPEAVAQDSSSTCSEWEVRNLDFYFCTRDSDVCSIPSGWEPFAYHGGGTNLMLRRCIR